MLTNWKLWAGIAVVLAIFLVFRTNILASGIAPFALLLICPLMMMFMHGGHGDHKSQKKGEHHE